MEKMRNLVLTLEKGFFERKLQNQEWKKVKEGMTGWQDVVSQLGKQGSVDDAKFRVSTASGSFKKPDKCLVNGQEMTEYLQVQVPDCPPP